MQVSGSIEAIQRHLHGNGGVEVKAERDEREGRRQKPERVDDDSRRRDGFEFKRSRLREARHFRKQEHRELYSAKRQLKHIAHAVRDELKEIGRAADDPANGDLKHTLSKLNKGFRQDIKQAFRDARDGRSLDREQLIADTRAAFERLVEDVRAALGPVAVAPPADERVDDAPLTSRPTALPGSEGNLEVSQLNGIPAPSSPVENRAPLEDLIGRIENLLAKLTELLTPTETEDRPESASFTVEIAVTIYARATFSYEGQTADGALDAVS